MELLTSSDLVKRIAADFSRSGIVGESTNALVGYLAAISRKLERPLALLIQSTSPAGKSSVLDAVLHFVPEEDRMYSVMTGQSLFYMGDMNLKHKVLAIAEEERAHRASYAPKLLQSDVDTGVPLAAVRKATTDNLTVL
jgi:DNA primase